MKTIERNPSYIENVLIDNIKNENVIFVFSTDVALNSWVEWCIKNTDKTGVKAVALDRFIAWDEFKENYAVAKERGRHSIPSLLRKAFVYDLISQNEKAVKKGEKPLFRSIINPLYVSSSSSFVDWIAGNLTMLDLWYKKFTLWSSKTGLTGDAEDSDYVKLYLMYKEFLGDDMFEPSWETPDFTSCDKKFILFYPEQMEDYQDYKDVLKDADKIDCYILPESDDNKPCVIKYTDSRREVRRTVLKIRNIVEGSDGKINYEDIALTVPDLENLKPYVKRELDKYCIPYVIRAGEKLTVSSAASIFEDFNKCNTDNFSYDSVRQLVLNDYIPWKTKELNLNLVKEGQRLHIVCNRSSNIKDDEWVRTLSRTGKSERELKLYIGLRKAVVSICQAKSFKNIKTGWLKFKSDFLDEKEFSDMANKILGRCITELDELIEIENDYIIPKNLLIGNYYEFFLRILKSKSYRPQESISGLNVFDYKLSASSSFRYNFIINSSQSCLTVPYRPMSFINNKKRAMLGITDSDYASTAFIRLYNKYNDTESGKTIFSYSEDSFSGFSIPHNYFAYACEDDDDEIDSKDFIKSEKDFFICGKNISSISQKQIEEFNSWKSTADFSKVIKKENISQSIKNRIKNILVDNRSKNSENKTLMRITQSDMENFFPCQRNWIFKTVFPLREDDLQSSLLKKYDQGNINHKVLELMFKKLEVLPYTKEDGTFGEDEDRIILLIKECVQEAINSPSMNFCDSPLVIDILKAQSFKFEAIILSFLKRFCDPVSKNNFAGYTVYAIEKWYDGINNDLHFMYLGKIDCILQSPDGESLAIVDYKNTKLPSIKSCLIDEENNVLGDFQCAMYVKLVKINRSESEIGCMVFKSITKPKSNVVIDKDDAKKTLESFEPTMELFDKYASTFCYCIEENILTPERESVTKMNDVDVYKNCFDCSYKAICRTSFTVASHKL